MLQQPPDAAVDLGLERTHLRAQLGAEVLVFCAHHAPAVLGRNRDGVIVYDLVQTVTSASRRLLRPAQSSANRFEAGQETLEQELLLVRDVVIDRGLGDAERCRDVVQRRVVITALVERPDVDYVSIKVSSVASQLSTWDTGASRDRVLATLVPLYRTARAHGTFLNLDMEEYHDLALTVEVFERLCALPELADASLGLVRRVAEGGSRVKVRLVKGANLAMEQVEAELHGWPQAPYPTKADVDASYVRLVDRALDPERTRAVRIGLASHNLFHVAMGHLLAAERGVSEALDVEMLQGMAPAQARAVRDTG